MGVNASPAKASPQQPQQQEPPSQQVSGDPFAAAPNSSPAAKSAPAAGTHKAGLATPPKKSAADILKMFDTPHGQVRLIAHLTLCWNALLSDLYPIRLICSEEKTRSVAYKQRHCAQVQNAFGNGALPGMGSQHATAAYGGMGVMPQAYGGMQVQTDAHIS